MADISDQEKERIEALVGAFEGRRASLEDVLTTVDSMITEGISPGGPLEGLVHSVKQRIKNVESFRNKLRGKIQEAHKLGVEFDITPENLFEKVTDLAGYRIMHLHPKEMDTINKAILQMLKDRTYELIEGPEARVWDLESKAYFESIGIKTKPTEKKLYSSVHYIIRAKPRAPVTCELQVRTVADELWGAVDHRIRYKQALESIACIEQIKSLAHLTTSCNRLVTSIFASYDEWKKWDKAKSGPAK